MTTGEPNRPAGSERLLVTPESSLHDQETLAPVNPPEPQS